MSTRTILSRPRRTTQPIEVVEAAAATFALTHQGLISGFLANKGTRPVVFAGYTAPRPAIETALSVLDAPVHQPTNLPKILALTASYDLYQGLDFALDDHSLPIGEHGSVAVIGIEPSCSTTQRALETATDQDLEAMGEEIADRLDSAYRTYHDRFARVLIIIG